jgi:hypothetical protein
MRNAKRAHWDERGRDDGGLATAGAEINCGIRIAVVRSAKIYFAANNNVIRVLTPVSSQSQSQNSIPGISEIWAD